MSFISAYININYISLFFYHLIVKKIVTNAENDIKGISLEQYLANEEKAANEAQEESENKDDNKDNDEDSDEDSDDENNPMNSNYVYIYVFST